MTDRHGRAVLAWRSRWFTPALIAAAMLVGIVFVTAQTVSSGSGDYGSSVGSPSPPAVQDATGSILDGQQDRVAASLRMQDVVEVGNAPAVIDRQRIDTAIGTSGIRVLQTPYLATDADRNAAYDLSNQLTAELRTEGRPGGLVRVEGLQVTFSYYQMSDSDIYEVGHTLSTLDVTDSVLSAIAELKKSEISPHQEPPVPGTVDPARLGPPHPRAATTAELAPILAALRSGNSYAAPGLALLTTPASAGKAFGGRPVKLVHLPPASATGPTADVAPALAAAFPGAVVLVARGYHLQYAGPEADQVALALSIYFSRYAFLLERGTVPVPALLASAVNEIAGFRGSGVFDRPQPEQVLDATGMVFPVLPVIFGVLCLLIAIRETIRLRRRPIAAIRDEQALDELSGLTRLLLETSGLVRGADAALAHGRAAAVLTAAQQAVRSRRPSSDLRTQLELAAEQLGEVAALLGRKDYRPDSYLRLAYA